MIWVLIFGGIALGGLIMLVCYAIWLAHKASDLASEFTMLNTRAEELQALLAQLDTAPLEGGGSRSGHLARVSVDSENPSALTSSR